ncbi:hypothetical protein ATO2_07520 [Roseovarius sp. 22II1-1F6A]|nr:hypothetical protein ATO2_07520 [Roseovarius sp. 22II1-1F6A]
MFKRILRPVTGAALAITVALTGWGASTAPAAALTTDELIRLMAGAAIVQSAERARDTRQDDRRHWQQTDRYNNRGNDYGRWDQDGRRRDHPATPLRNRKVLPASCRIVLDTRNGTRRYFAERCLQRQTDLRSLPRECQRYVRLNRGTIRAYEQGCMKDRGYKVKG